MLQVLSLVPSGLALAQETDPQNPDFGKKIFLWNALPGEIVTSFTPLKRKRSYSIAFADQLAQISPARVGPRDPCFLSTSPWQIFSWDFELEQKRQLIVESFAQEHLPYSCPIAPVQTDHQEWHYRNKMEYSLYWDNVDQTIYLAFHRRNSHQKIPLKASESSPSNDSFGALPSSIERPEIAQKALEIVQELNSTGHSAREFQSLLLRVNQQGEISGGLYPNGQPHPNFAPLQDTLLDHTYFYSPNGFFQINLPVYELALQAIRAEITTAKVLDLYSGVGTIGLSVAADHELTLVESNPAAFTELEHNVATFTQSASTKPPRAILTRSEEALDFIQPNQTVILDPPRAGCDSKLLARLLETLPEKIIYLSCNPTTQARDLRILLESHHFRITQIIPYNFFPKTPHIENLVILSRH